MTEHTKPEPVTDFSPNEVAHLMVALVWMGPDPKVFQTWPQDTQAAVAKAMNNTYIELMPNGQMGLRVGTFRVISKVNESGEN
ncbi:hypothetical protein OG394_27805 [Kribbella sp. NBC_01245]|uniref:hypothetical protein n=1 Tax=Kribbella sp. NBC_01245 TaxID=2903578 RepID=UPI002E2D9E17|nr:hypothetical protein [Kribbella sp. NBC_01245]